MNNPLAGTDPSGYLWCGTGSLGKAECDDEQKRERPDFGSVGFRAVKTIPVNVGPARSNGARHGPRSAATGERERGAIGGPGEGGSSAESDSSFGDNRYLTASTDDAQFHWDGKHTDGPKITKTTTEYETHIEFEGTLKTPRATNYELQTTLSTNLLDVTKTRGLPVGPGIDVAIDWNNYNVIFQIYSLYEVTTTQTSWSRETVAISSITGQKIRYRSKVSSPPKVVRTSLGRYWTIKGKTGQKVGTMKFPLPVPVPTR